MIIYILWDSPSWFPEVIYSSFSVLIIHLVALEDYSLVSCWLQIITLIWMLMFWSQCNLETTTMDIFLFALLILCFLMKLQFPVNTYNLSYFQWEDVPNFKFSHYDSTAIVLALRDQLKSGRVTIAHAKYVYKESVGISLEVYFFWIISWL